MMVVLGCLDLNMLGASQDLDTSAYRTAMDLIYCTSTNCTKYCSQILIKNKHKSMILLKL
jgi:hypothetical protein